MTRVQSTLLAGLAVLAAAGFFIPREPDQDPVAGSAEITEGPPPLSKNSPGPPARPDPSVSRRLAELPPPALAPRMGSAENREWIDRRVTELDALAWFDDSESLLKILAEFQNPLPEIRAAALKATKEFGSRDAIPYLELIARNTTDPLEQRSIGDLVEFLNLPTLLEVSDHDSR